MGIINKLTIISTLVLPLTVLCVNAYGSTCSPGEALARAEWASFGKVKKVVAIEPFEDQSKEKHHSWLRDALPDLMGGYFSSGKGVGLLEGLTRNYPPGEAVPNYIVSGAYQKGPDALRVFIKVYSPEAADGLIYQGAFSITPPDTGRLFIEMDKVVQKIFKLMGIGIDKKQYAYETGSTSDYKAFEAYERGLEAMRRFDPGYLDVAMMWFKEAIKDDVYYQKPYLAIADTYGYLAMEAKSKGMPHTPYLEKLESIENARMRFAKRPSAVAEKRPRVIKKDLKPRVENRFLSGNSYYMAGVEALSSGDLKKAIRDLEKAVAFVPEDSAALMNLYNVYTQADLPKKAGEVLNKINTDGICR